MEKEEFENWIEQDDAFDTQKLLAGVDLTNVQADVDLEEILAEYGTRREVPPTEDGEESWINEGYVPRPVHPEGNAARKTEKKAPQRPPEVMAEPPAAEKSDPADWDPEPQSLYEPQKPAAERPAPHREIPLEDVMAQVVDAVMEEEENRRQVAQPTRRRGLFSRKERTLEDTEAFRPVQDEETREKVSYVEEEEEEEAYEEPERDSRAAAADYNRRYVRLHRRAGPALLTALAAAALAAAEYSAAAAAYLTFELSAILSLTLLGLQLVVCFPVVKRAAVELFHLRCTPELLISVFAFAALADNASVWLTAGRGTQMPMSVVAAAALYFTMRGEMLRLRGLRDSCHMAGHDKQPYVVSAVAGGFRKQSCDSEGFIRMTECESEHAAWYTTLLPVILVATVTFAALSAVNRFDSANFLWYWSVILAAASSFAFTAAFGTPLGKLAQRLKRGGCAVAAYSGAEMMRRKGSMILTDQDLFPPGTVFMNGMKVYAHDAFQAVSYASSLIDASGCGLRQVFADLRRSQGGRTYPVEEFSFYEEGGISGVICGESVLLGRADFMAQMGIRLPREIKLKTGVFLAVDKELVAVFAIKYMASDNVDAALQMILHNGIQPVFAVRDFNITPALLKRKFKINTKKRCLYPALSQRLALSEEERVSNRHPGALLFREGLMPYAETVVGGKRMHGAVCKSCAWALAGSVCGTLLAFYLVFMGGFAVLTPAALLAFQLLWSVPSAMVNGWVTQY